MNTYTTPEWRSEIRRQFDCVTRRAIAAVSPLFNPFFKGVYQQVSDDDTFQA